MKKTAAERKAEIVARVRSIAKSQGYSYISEADAMKAHKEVSKYVSLKSYEYYPAMKEYFPGRGRDFED